MLSVSVVIPCYNGERFLAEALTSVREQCRSADEVIVVDDGSSDDSVGIAHAHGARVIQQENRGEGAARNAGLAAASGDVIASLDADDRWRPHHLATVVGLLESAPGAVGAFGAVQRFGSRDELIEGCIPPGSPASVLVEAFENWLHTTISSVVRRDSLREAGGFDERERYAVDFDLWLRLAKRHRFVATHEVTADWRMHGDQQSATPWRQMDAVYRYRRRFIEEMRREGDSRCAEFERLFNRVWYREVRDRLLEGDYRGAGSLLSAASLVRPWSWS